MARNNSSPVQQFRGTTAQHATYTGLPGELTVDTDKHVVVVHDGSTAGGVPMARADHRHQEYSIGTASGTVSGTTKLSDATNSTSDVNSGVAATPKAVKAAYDKAVEAQNSGILLGINWIGIPRYWRSTNLPPNHCWANGDFVEFADWPELKQVYEAGGFEGMLLPWDADSRTKAANLGKWRPDAANPTGLFTPNLGGQFLRNWVPGNVTAGAYNNAGVPNFPGEIILTKYMFNTVTGPFQTFGEVAPYPTSGAYGSGYYKMKFDPSLVNSIYGGADTVMPPSINQPVCLYLGRPSQI